MIFNIIKLYTISFLCKHNFFIDEKHTQWMLDTKEKVFHESISCFMKWPWNCISWNALKEKFHSVSFPLDNAIWSVWIEYNMKNIFLETWYTKCGGETVPRPFSKKLKLSISMDQYSKVIYSSLLLYVKLRAIERYWNWAADHLLLPHLMVF